MITTPNKDTVPQYIWDQYDKYASEYELSVYNDEECRQFVHIPLKNDTNINFIFHIIVRNFYLQHLIKLNYQNKFYQHSMWYYLISILL